jgi:hypothetical protein
MLAIQADTSDRLFASESRDDTSEAQRKADDCRGEGGVPTRPQRRKSEDHRESERETVHCRH